MQAVQERGFALSGCCVMWTIEGILVALLPLAVLVLGFVFIGPDGEP